MQRHKWSKIMVGAGVVFLLLAGVWRVWGVPLLVRFPDDVDVDVAYEGTFVVKVNPSTMKPVDGIPETDALDPIQIGLRIDRHIEADTAKSSFSTVVLREDIKASFTNPKLAEAFDIDPPAPESNSYTMNRRTMQLGGGVDSWAYSPDNLVNRTGTYRISMPFEFDDQGTYAMWTNELGHSYDLQGSGHEHMTTAGLNVLDFGGSSDGVVADYYKDRLTKQGIPDQATFGALAAFLGETEAANLDDALGRLAGALDGSDAALVRGAAETAVPLTLSYFFDGRVGIEPKTGAIVDAHAVVQGVRFAPDVQVLDELAGVAGSHRSAPGASAVLSAINRLANLEPQAFFEVHYNELPEAVTDTVNEVKSSVAQKDLAEVWVQWGLVWIGVALILGAGVVYGRVERFARRAAREAHQIDLVAPEVAGRERTRTGV